jgi:hypothetical protein
MPSISTRRFLILSGACVALLALVIAARLFYVNYAPLRGLESGPAVFFAVAIASLIWFAVVAIVIALIGLRIGRLHLLPRIASAVLVSALTLLVLRYSAILFGVVGSHIRDFGENSRDVFWFGFGDFLTRLFNGAWLPVYVTATAFLVWAVVRSNAPSPSLRARSSAP